MTAFWIMVVLVVVILLWAGWVLRGRAGPGPEASGDRWRRSGGREEAGGGPV